MLHKSIYDGATAAERMRNAIRRRGEVRGHPLWTNSEDATIRACYPDYSLLVKKLDRRSYYAIRNRVRALSIQKIRHVWTAKEISQLRRMYLSASRTEILSTFPFATWTQLKAILAYYKIRRPRKRLAPTPFPIIDAIRSRCHELGYSMVDLDEIAGTGCYFKAANWFGHRTYNASYVRMAVEALGGNLSVTWSD